MDVCIFRSGDSKTWRYCHSGCTGFFSKLRITSKSIAHQLWKTVLLPLPRHHFYLTVELEDKKGLLQQSLIIMDENTLCCPFVFHVTPQKETTTYFLVMFDFHEENVLILGQSGLSGPGFHKTLGEWDLWKGHTLWWNLYTALVRPGFKELERTEPTVYKTDLILVAKPIYLYI